MRRQIVHWILWLGAACVLVSLTQMYWPGTLTGLVLIILGGYLWKKVEK